MRRVMAVAGAAVGLVGVMAAVGGEGPVPAWLLRLFAAWCVVTPYWWYLEARIHRPPGDAARAFDAGQRHSFRVWLGFTLAMAVPMVMRGA